MGGIWRPAGRKRYRIWYKGADGSRQTAPGFRDKAASEKKLRDLERDEERRAAGLPVVDRKAKPQSLEDLKAKYVADLIRQGSGPDAQKAAEGNIRRLAERASWKTLRDVRHASMTDALSALLIDGRSPRTVEIYRSTWIAFLNWCVDRSLIQENPLARVRGNRRIEKVRPKRAPTMDEWRRLIDTAPPRRRDTYLVASLTGLRRKECRLLERRDVDLVEQVLRLRSEAVKGKRAETVPIVPDVLPTLRRLCGGLEPVDRLLPHTPHAYTITADIARAGIVSPDATGRHVTFHSLRYFFCTLLAKTLPIQTVRLLMRHRDISMTCKVYLDLGLTDVAEDMKKLPKLFAHPLAHPDDEAVEPKPRRRKR